MSDLIIRKIEGKDIAEIERLENICFPHDPWSEESIRESLLNYPSAFCLVAETDDKIVGYMGLWKIVDEGHIMNVAVDPDYRRRHIADAILAVMFDVTRENGIDSWTLEVRVDNEPAINLYKKFGFVEEGIRKGYYEYDHTDALIMWKRAN